MSFTGFSDSMSEFFLQIRFNNNASFFEEHRKDYEANVKQPLFAFAEALVPTIEAIDPRLETRPVKVVSRIRRDTRFSRDKSPYRDHMWIGWRSSDTELGKSVLPGLYFGLEVDTWEVGCGYYAATPVTMRALRQKIMASPSSFLSIVEDPFLMENYRLLGDEYKRPKYPEDLDERLRRWFQKKSFYFDHTEPWSGIVYQAAFVEEVTRYLSALAPLYRYLSELPIMEG